MSENIEKGRTPRSDRLTSAYNKRLLAIHELYQRGVCSQMWFETRRAEIIAECCMAFANYNLELPMIRETRSLVNYLERCYQLEMQNPN